MSSKKSRLMLNISILIAMIITLLTLALGFMGDRPPLESLIRSGIVFVTFLVLGWIAALILVIPDGEQIFPIASKVATNEKEPRDESRIKVGL